MQNDKQEPIKPAYPLGDANLEPSPKPAPPQKDPKAAPEPQVVHEPQTDG